jgi:hypothetical protein
MFEDKFPRGLSGPNREKETGEWKKKVHYEELHNFYSSPNNTRLVKSRMRWAR